MMCFTFIGRAVFVLSASDGAHSVEADVAEEAIVVHRTGQHAVALDALFVEGALAVRRAAGHAASFLAAHSSVALAVPLAGRRDADAFVGGRSGESWRAVADLLVVFRPAQTVEATSVVRQTGVDTLAAKTGLRVGTIVAGLASRLADSSVAVGVGWAFSLSATGDGPRSAADGFDVAAFAGLETLATDARRFVVVRQAVGIGSASDADANVDAFRFPALLAADGRRWAVLVGPALDGLLAALLVRLADGSSGTGAAVGAARVVATSARSAGRLGAVVDGNAAGHHVTGEAGLALADGRVTFREAERVFAANIFHHAGDFAAVVVTSFVRRAVRVLGAFNPDAADLVVLRISKVALFAGAHRLAVDHRAAGIPSAEHGALARVAAFGPSVFRLEAALPLVAFLVASTAHLRNADAVEAGHGIGAGRIVGAGRTTFSFDALLRWQTVAARLAARDAGAGHAGLR